MGWGVGGWNRLMGWRVCFSLTQRLWTEALALGTSIQPLILIWRIYANEKATTLWLLQPASDSGLSPHDYSLFFTSTSVHSFLFPLSPLICPSSSWLAFISWAFGHAQRGWYPANFQKDITVGVWHTLAYRGMSWFVKKIKLFHILVEILKWFICRICGMYSIDFMLRNRITLAGFIHLCLIHRQFVQ